MSMPARQPEAKASRHSAYVYSIIAREVSTLTRYYDRLIQWRPRPEDSRLLFRFAEAKISEELAQIGHGDQVAPADIDSTQKRDVNGHEELEETEKGLGCFNGSCGLLCLFGLPFYLRHPCLDQLANQRDR